MKTTMFTTSLIVFGLFVVGGCGQSETSIDAGDGADGSDAAIGTIEITVTHPSIDPLVYTIGCLGDAFPVTPAIEGVDGSTACELLKDPAVRSRLLDGPPADQVCTEIYGGDDKAVIVGEIDATPVDATITRANGCEIDAWESMIGILPAALGMAE
jgi:hypothetical protein